MPSKRSKIAGLTPNERGTLKVGFGKQENENRGIIPDKCKGRLARMT